MSKPLHQVDSTVETKLNEDGTPNPKYVDLLDEDKPIAGQNFVCLSFISPEKILKNKELFMFEHFIKQWEFTKNITKYREFFSYISFKYNLKLNNMMEDYEEFCKTEKENLKKTDLEDDFKNFIDANEDEMEKTFNSLYNFQTSTRGVKIRGVFPSQQEAELRSKMLRESDPNHDVYVGQVGLWMPFHPEAYKTGRVEYLEDELNQIMNEKIKNEKSVKEEFDTRIRETKEKAIEENKEKALKEGNKLTQTLDKEGNLVNVKEMNSTERGLNDSEVSAADIRKELFEGDEIIMDKDTDHGLSKLSEESQKKFRDAGTEDAGTEDAGTEDAGTEDAGTEDADGNVIDVNLND